MSPSDIRKAAARLRKLFADADALETRLRLFGLYIDVDRSTEGKTIKTVKTTVKISRNEEF